MFCGSSIGLPGELNKWSIRLVCALRYWISLAEIFEENQNAWEAQLRLARCGTVGAESNRCSTV